MNGSVYSLDELLLEYKKGNTYEFLLFWGHTPLPNGKISPSCFSQWWMGDFEVDGVRYSCAEQYMMAEKARLFNDERALTKIMNATSPANMKAYGREVRNFRDSVWNSNCVRIIKAANTAKFSQNPELLEFLLGTEGKILVEASPYDKIWGIGMEKNDPNAKNPQRWRGKNLLGFALTEVRDELLMKNN